MDDACIEWTMARNKWGYGVVKRGGKLLKAHRVAYVAAKGEIPSGLQIDHLCRNRACVNPEHLEAVTHAENIRRGNSPSAINARKAVCSKAGHDLADAYITPGGGRQCRLCKLDADRAYRTRRALALRATAHS